MGRKLDDNEVLGSQGIDRVAECLRSLLPFVSELFDTTPILPLQIPSRSAFSGYRNCWFGVQKRFQILCISAGWLPWIMHTIARGVSR